MTEPAYTDVLTGLAQAVAADGPHAERTARDSFMLEGVGVGALSGTPISQAAIDLLIAAEVSSPAVYTAKYTHPVWPGGNSGVTIGIGYDVGTVTQTALAQDWLAELGQAATQSLGTACGIMGPQAAPIVGRLGAITIPFDQANRVFLRRSVPEFIGDTERALPNTNLIGPDCLGALVSLTYNRGAAYGRPEDRFREMRAIHDHMADRQFALIPDEFRSMKRIWAGKPGLEGVVLRREAEAQLFERGLANLPAAPAALVASVPRAEGFVGVATAVSDAFSTVGGWLRPVVEEATRDRLMFRLTGGDDDLITPDEDYVAVRVLSGRIVNARRWASLYHGAVHATCNMLYEGIGSERCERQSVLAPDGFRDIDPKGQGKLLQVDRPLFGPMPYRGDLRMSIALFSVKSSDLAAPYLSLISELSQTASLGFLAAAQPFIAPLSKAADLLFGTSDAASLECGTVRGFEPLRAGTWVCLGATRQDIPDTSGFRVDPEDFRLLDGAGRPVQAFPYLVFQILKLAQRDNWMEIPGLKAAWDAISTALYGDKPEDAPAAAKTFRRMCFAGGDLTLRDAARLAEKADRKVALTLGTAASIRPEGVAATLRSLDLYGQ